MPFESAEQRRFMYARHPKIAKRWTEKYGSKIRKKENNPHPHKKSSSVMKRLTKAMKG